MVESKKRLVWGSIGYAYATALGFIYADAYYGTFEIAFLNYVTVLDFLLISLSNIRELVATGFVAILIVLSVITFLGMVYLLFMFVEFTCRTVANVLMEWSVYDWPERAGRRLRGFAGRMERLRTAFNERAGENIKALVTSPGDHEMAWAAIAISAALFAAFVAWRLVLRHDLIDG